MAVLKGGTTIGGYEATHKGNLVRLFGESGIATGMSVAERAKLAGIADSANNYVHPANHPPSIITQDINNRFFTDTERARLAAMADGANNYVHPATHAVGMITGLANSATIPATNANTANQIVQRDANGDFSARVITATLSGNATSATTATTAVRATYAP